MANIVWRDTKGKIRKATPFQSYITDHTFSFADWLIGDYHTHDNEYKKYGSIMPNNLLGQLNSIRKRRSYLGSFGTKEAGESGTLGKLKILKAQLLKKEQELYQGLGCGDFKGFLALWTGENAVRGKAKNREKQRWLNLHLEFMTGEYQRMFSNTHLSPFEALFNLYAVVLDRENIQGMEQIKKTLKNKLIKEGFEKLCPKDRTAQGEDAYLKHAKYNYFDFQEKLKEILTDSYNIYTIKDGKEVIGESIKDMLDGQKLGNYLTIQARHGNKKGQKRYQNMFVGGMYKIQNKTKKQALQQILKWLNNYFNVVRKAALSEAEYKEWEEFAAKGGQKYIETQMETLVNRFFNEDSTVLIAQNNASLMGLLGELSTYGRLLFHLPKKREKTVSFYSVGNLQNTKIETLGTDIVISINKGSTYKSYGIQVKNPYQTDQGRYETYKTTWNLGDKQTPQNLKRGQRANFYDILGLTQDEIDIFEFINLNLSNTTVTHAKVKSAILSFLNYYSFEFGRLNEEQIADSDWNKYAQEQAGKIQHKMEQRISNLFFVLKGEIIQTSSIVQGLIEQYKQIRSQENKEEIKRIVKIDYSNTIPENYHEVGDLHARNIACEGELKGHLYERYNKDLINPRENLMNQVIVRTSLNLTIPSLQTTLKRIAR